MTRLHTTHPRPALPIIVGATGVCLGVLAIVALLTHAFVFAGLLLVAALIPFRSPLHLRGVGFALGLAVVGWSVLGVGMLFLAGDALQGPFGGPVWLFATSLILGAARVWTLERECSYRAAHTRWIVGLDAQPLPLPEALKQALRAPSETRNACVDQAVVSLAAAAPGDIPNDVESRRAFWINVYNTLSMHASRDRESTAAWDVFETFRTRYAVAGQMLSLDEIEHGLLRGNARAPASLRACFSPGDPRLAWGVPLDARVHFALNCGARSCPPVRVFNGSDLDAQLNIAEAAFITAETEVDTLRGAVRTSRILHWYADDFGGNDAIYSRIKQHIAEIPKGLPLQFRSYDWTPPEA